MHRRSTRSGLRLLGLLNGLAFTSMLLPATPVHAQALLATSAATTQPVQLFTPQTAIVPGLSFQSSHSSTDSIPLLAVLPPDPESVYAPPVPKRPEDGVNEGGVNVDVNFHYLSDYVYRGISHNFAVSTNPDGTRVPDSDRHAANYVAEARLSFDLGKLPHPFVGVLANINDSDPLSRFQEIWPYAGVDYTLRPLEFEVGVNAYIYPERERSTPSPNTSEVYLKLTVDDSYWLLTERPLLEPYLYVAYDYQRNHGMYFEAGIKHDFVVEDIGLTLSLRGDVGYVNNFAQIFTVTSPQDCGFQHYDIGVVASESINDMFHLPSRYGKLNLEGLLFYTSAISDVAADTTLWGGVGITFHY